MYAVTRDHVREMILLWEQNPQDIRHAQQAACFAYHSEAGCDDYVAYVVVTLLADTDVERRIEDIPYLLKALDNPDGNHKAVVDQLCKELQISITDWP